MRLYEAMRLKVIKKKKKKEKKSRGSFSPIAKNKIGCVIWISTLPGGINFNTSTLKRLFDWKHLATHKFEVGFGRAYILFMCSSISRKKLPPAGQHASRDMGNPEVCK